MTALKIGTLTKVERDGKNNNLNQSFMKKNTRFTGMVSLIFFFGISCTNDSAGPQPKVEYRVNASSDMMVNVWYRDNKGNMIEQFTPDGMLQWHKLMNVDRPFNATLQAGFYNSGITTETCDVEIYVDDVLMESYPNSLPASQSYTLFAHYDIGQ
jgi:hypothetical protein